MGSVNDEQPARHQNAPRFSHHVRYVRYVLQHMVSDHAIETAVIERPAIIQVRNNVGGGVCEHVHPDRARRLSPATAYIEDPRQR